MAEFDFFEPVNMRGNGSAPSYGYVTEASSGWIHVTGSYWEEDYFGYGFTYSETTVTGGVLTDFYGDMYGSMVVAINGMQVSVAAVVHYIAAGDVFTAMSIMASGNDVITCWGYGADVVYAWGGNDYVYGMTGNDYLNGGTGADVMVGGYGNDVFVIDQAGDRVFEYAGQGTDAAYTSVSFALAAGQHIETLVTTSQAGTRAINLTGNELAQRINGNNGVNTINGGGGNDTISGFNGNDKLIGGAGIDTLIGGANSDIFVFNAPRSAANRDVVTDFNHVADTFHVENAVFTHLGSGVHTLASSMLRLGTKALDGNDFLIYNKATGVLSYDHDANGTGAAITIATLTNHPVLAANDFLVI